jgi:hypothetical protein
MTGTPTRTNLGACSSPFGTQHFTNMSFDFLGLVFMFDCKTSLSLQDRDVFFFSLSTVGPQIEQF